MLELVTIENICIFNICFQAVTLGCSHSFCEFCINSWKSKCFNQTQCPICRKVIKTEVRSIVLDQYISKIVEKLDQELLDVRNEIVQQRRGKTQQVSVRWLVYIITIELFSTSLVVCTYCKKKINYFSDEFFSRPQSSLFYRFYA